MLLSKKRYVGYAYESPAQAEPKFDAKGIETVRRDTCPAVQKMMEKSLRMLFTDPDLSAIKAYVQVQFPFVFELLVGSCCRSAPVCKNHRRSCVCTGLCVREGGEDWILQQQDGATARCGCERASNGAGSDGRAAVQGTCAVRRGDGPAGLASGRPGRHTAGMRLSSVAGH